VSSKKLACAVTSTKLPGPAKRTIKRNWAQAPTFRVARSDPFARLIWALFGPPCGATRLPTPTIGQLTTSREYALLAYFLQHPDQVLTRPMIAEQVWGYDFDNFSNVVDVYVGYLRNKVDRGFEPRLIQTVRGVGYLLKPPP
jgi:transcriptional regulator